MDWTEIQVTVPVERVDEAGAIVSMTVPYGIYIEDYSDMEEEVLEIAHIDLIDEELLDYVVVHELAHRKEMNHSPRFWRVVEDTMPEYRKYQKWLKENGRGLHRY